MYHWRQNRVFRGVAILTIAIQLVFPPLAIAQSNPQIVTDGRTQTNLSVNGNITDITTSTISGNTGLNSFQIFNVFQGNTVNLFLPDQADNLVNMVTEQQTVIDGFLNAYKDGQIGGNVYFLNPYGVMVGNSGVVNVGSLHFSTPTHDFMQSMFPQGNVLSAPVLGRVLDNDIPLSKTGVIDVRGAINAQSDLSISAGDISVSGQLKAGETAKLAVDELVNMSAMSLADGQQGMITLDDVTPSINLSAENNITMAGLLSVDGADNVDAGVVELLAKKNISVLAGADISADGQGNNSDGGQIMVMAENRSDLAAGAALSANAGATGDGGFVEFSARNIVSLNGGSLSAAASQGEQGTVLIDPAAIEVNAHILRDASAAGGSDNSSVTWNAGSLILQADDNITIASNVVVSSRRVASAGDANAHRNSSSIADSGDITLDSQKIIMNSGSLVTAEGSAGFDGGRVTFDADSPELAQIIIDNASVKGAEIILDADAVQSDVSVYANPTGVARADIQITDGSVIEAGDNITITTSALQEDPGYAGGILFQFDARRAQTVVNIEDSSLTASDDITISGDSEVQTDLSKQGWANLASLLPIDVAVAVTESKSDIEIGGNSQITSSSGDVNIEAGADTRSTVYANSTSLGLGLVAGVSVTDNQANVTLGDTATVSGGDVSLRSRTKSQITAVGDASAAPIAGVSGSLAGAVGILNDNTTTRVTGDSTISATGDVDVLADSEVSAIFAARATSDDNFTQTVTDKFDAGIDNTSQLDQEFMGVNLADILKSGVAEIISELASALAPSDNGSGGNEFQIGGALVYADVKNNTVAEISVDNASTSTTAPAVTAGGDIGVIAQGITQAQSFASGRTDNPTFGGQAGIGIQLVENRLTARIGGADAADVDIEGAALAVKAESVSYSGDFDNASKFGVFASSGVGGGGGDDDSNGVGIAGAIAIGINEVNDTLAIIDDNSSLDISGDVAVAAVNETEVKVTADGSSEAHQAADELFGLMIEDNGSTDTTDPEISGGKLGIGGSLAVATHKNMTRAILAETARFTGSDNPDNISITTEQTSSTEAEAKAAGAGSISLVPLAAVTVARNTARATIEAGSAITTQGNISVSSQQTVKSSAVGNGEAKAGDDGKFALGIAAGVSVALDSNETTINRDLTTNGGNIEVLSRTYREIEAGAKSLSSAEGGGDGGDGDGGDGGGGDGDGDSSDNSTEVANSTEDASEGLSGLMSGMTSEPDDDATSYDFSSQMSIDTDTVTDGADLGSIGGDGDNESSSKITIAAAMGVNYAEAESRAVIADNVTLNAGTGSITVSSLSNNDMAANADASVSGGDYNIGGGVGLNIVQNDNEAKIGSGVSITSGDFTVQAGMFEQLQDDNSTDDTNVITAEAVAGAGTGEFSLAGSVGLNVVVRNSSSAIVTSGSTVNASGDILVSAASKNKYKTDAKATVGMTNTMWDGIDETFSTLTDLKVWTEAAEKGFEGMLDNLQASLGSDDNSSDSDGGDGGDGGGDGGGTGIGAGISVNIIVAENTKAIIEDNAVLSGTAASVGVIASAESEIETNAFAGAKPDEAGGEAKTSLDAAVSVGVLLKDVDAKIGSGSALSASDNITISASTQTNTLSTAKGEVSADSTAVGASVAVGVALESAEARLERNVTSSSGGVAVTAQSASTDVALADAVAAGTVVDKYSERLGKLPEDFTQQTSQLGDVDNGPTSLEALKGGFTGGDGASFDLSGSDSSTGSTSGGEAQQSGSLNIAASVAVNWADHAARAIVADGVQISAGDDVSVTATNDANYRTRGSGMSVFADQSIGVGVGLLKTGQQTDALVGDNVGITITGSTGDVLVAATTTENQGTDEDGESYRSFASSEGIAGAGGGELGIAGSLSLVFSYDSQEAKIGDNVDIVAPGNIGITSTATNKIVNRAWAVAVASDVTCDNPGNCGSSSGDKTAVGASIAVNIVIDNNSAMMGEGSTLAAGDNVTIAAQDLASGAGNFTLDPLDNTTSSEDYLTTNYTAQLQDSSYYAEAIAGGVAQGGNAGSGSLAVTVSVGKTEAIVGEGASISGAAVDISAYNESEARHLVGAVALSTDKKAIGASISGIYLREDVRTIIGDDGASDDGDNTTITASTGDIDISAEADQDTLTFMAAGGVSGNDLALAGAFGFNVMDTDVEARIVEDAMLQASSGSVGVTANSFTNIRNIAIAVAGSGGSNSAGGTLTLNMFLTDKKAIVGNASASDNNIIINAAEAVNIGVNAKQEILNGIISASVSTSSNALSGALSANVVKGESYAIANQGVDINDNASLNTASTTQSVDVTAEDNTTITDLTGTIAASSSNSVGIALGANVFWKDVVARANGTIKADENVRVMADTRQNLTSMVVGIAASTGGTTGAGSVGVGLIKSTTLAEIGSDADIYTAGSVQLHAGDDTDIFMMEPAASFSAGGNSLAGAVGAAVFVGQTKAKVKDGASIIALGNSAVQAETETTQTSSPLLDGIMGGDDNQTRETLGSFNDDFTFDNVKDLFLTETRDTETKRGVAVTAVADQDVISIAASGAVSSSSAIAVSLSAGVGVGQVEASIGDADINVTSDTAHSEQDVLVRALSDTYWTDVSGAIAVGTGSAGVGIGGDIVVQVKDTRAFIATGADVRAADDVIVHAHNNDRIINSAISVGGGSSAGVSGAAAIGVVVNTTKAYVDGDVTAGGNLEVEAGAKSEHIQIAGGIGAGGTAGIGASFGIGFVKNETQAYIDENAVTNAADNTSVVADTTENAVSAVIAGGVGGTVGVSVSAGIKVHMSNTQAYIKGQVNQDTSLASADQNVNVDAINRINTIDVIGGIGGGGTVGVGVTLNALVVHNNAQAWIGGGPNTRVSAGGDIDVTATSAKTTKNFLLAGAAGGTVAVGGNIAVLLVGAEADDKTAEQTDSQDHGDVAAASDDRTQGVRLGDTISPDNSSGDYAATGFDFAELTTAMDDNNSAHGQIGNTFDAKSSNLSRNKTQAFIENGAIVRAGDDLTIEAADTTETIFAAAAIGGAGVVGVGATIGVLLINNTAEAYIGTNANVNAEGDILIRSRTAETVGSGALSAGGAGVASVQGTIMAQKTTSKSRAFIENDAVVNDNTSEAATQSVALRAESDTDLVSFSGSGGGAIVGVGITGDVMILEKETVAYIDDDASVRSGGDISVDAEASADMIQIAMSINGGVVGVTGAAGIAVANNLTQARIDDDAVVFANDAIRVQATDDTEIDAVIITGAGGVVGVSGSVGTYVFKSRTEALIGNNAQVTARANGDGITALSGTVDNSTVTVSSMAAKNQDGDNSSETFEQVEVSFDTTTKNGLQVAAVTYEDMNFAPIGVAGGVVGVAGVIATTVTNSTTRAQIAEGARINDIGDSSLASANQSVELLAASESQLNNISSGIGVGAVGVTFDIDTQVFKKTVEAKMLADAKARRNVTVQADSRNRVYQTAITVAGGAVGVGGIVEVSVVNDTVTAEIGDNTTVTAGNNVLVEADSDLGVVQTAGNIAAGGVGVGASMGILVAKSQTTARIGENASVHASNNLTVRADSDNSINQNIIGFGAGGVAVSGSMGIAVLKTQTLAEIDNGAQINQQAEDNNSTQTVSVLANDTLTSQTAAGATAVGGAGAGMGLSVTASRNNTTARVGQNTDIYARRDVNIDASSDKTFTKSTVSAAGGGAGMTGSIALTILGGGMSGDAGSNLSDDDSNMVADAETEATRDRNEGDDETAVGNDGNSRKTSGKSNQLYGGNYDNESTTLAETEASGLQNDVEGTAEQATRAIIGSDAVITTGNDLNLTAEDNLTMTTAAGGVAAGAAAGIGITTGFLFNNAITKARVGDRSVLNATEATTIRARSNETVDKFGMTGGGGGVSAQATIMVNMSRTNTYAGTFDDVQINQTDNSSSTQSVTILAESDTNMVAVSGSGGVGGVGAGVSGDALVLEKQTVARIAENNQVSAQGDIAVDANAKTDILQLALSVNGGLLGLTGTAGIGIINNTTHANIHNNSTVFARDSMRINATDDTEIDAVAVSGAVGAVGGGSGSVGTYVLKSTTFAQVGQNVTLTALADNSSGQANGILALNGQIDNSTTSTIVKDRVGQDGNRTSETYTVTDASFGRENVTGLSVAAVTKEEVTFAPIGVAGGGFAGVSGVVATSISQSATRARIGLGSSVNQNNTDAGSNQDVQLLAISETDMNNVSAAVGIGALGLGLAFDLDTQVFTKEVEAKMLADVTAERDITVKAESTDRVYQTAASAGAGLGAGAGVAAVSVISNTVLAEIGDNVTARAGDDLTVDADQNISMIQTAGSAAGGAVGAGATVAVLYAKASNTARVGYNTQLSARDQLVVAADTDINMNQNVVGFAGGALAAISGSVGFNMLKNQTKALIENNAQVNQLASYNDTASQAVTVRANENVTTQGGAGAAAIGGAAGVGIGVAVTVNRGAVQASIGNNTQVFANDDIRITADATKNISNQGIAAAGGIGLGAAGSVALTLIGGSMSDNASDALNNDGGNMVAESDGQISQDRQANSQDNSSAGSQLASYTGSEESSANTLVQSQTSGFQSDVEGSGSSSTLAKIGDNAVIRTSGEVVVEAEETISLSQIAGGAAVGSVGVGGFVAVADYAGDVTASIGSNSVIDNASSLRVDAIINSGLPKTITLPVGSPITVAGVNSTVIGASVGIAGLAASVAQVNMSENASARIGSGTTVTLQDNSSAVTVDALRDVDTEVNVAAIAGGAIAAGVSYAGVNASGDVDAVLGNNVSIGTNAARMGNITIRSRNLSTQAASATSAAGALVGSAVGAIVNIDDSGQTLAEVGQGSALYSDGQINITADDRAENEADAVGVAIAGGVALSIISSDMDINRDATIQLGTGSTVVGQVVNLNSSIGQTGRNYAEADVTGASGGLLVGATGSSSQVRSDADSRIIVGNNAVIKVNSLDSGGEEVASGNLTINANNYAETRNDINAFAFGAAAFGAHLANTNQFGGTYIEIGAGSTIDSKGSASIQSTSSKLGLTDTVAGAGGLLAVNGGEAITNTTANNKIVFNDAANSSGRSRLNVADTLVLNAVNDDSYDSRIEASAIGAAAVTGGLAGSTGAANVGIRFGNFTEVDSSTLNVTSNNVLSKTGASGDNFAFSGGGGLTVTLGYAEAAQTQNSTIEFGQNADVYVRGTGTSQGHATILAQNNNTIRTSAKVSTGGAVSIPQSLARNTVTGNNLITFEDGALLATQRGNLDVKTLSNTLVRSHAKTSVWGLAGAGASGRAYSTFNSNENIVLNNGAIARGNGYTRIYAGQDLTESALSVIAKTDIYNKTLIPITTGLVANATLNRNAGVVINSGAKIQSARHLRLRAVEGNQLVDGDGFHQFLVLGIPVNESFGSASVSNAATITLNGSVETGVFNEQFIGFGRDFGTFVADTNTADPVDVARQNLVYDAATGLWQRRSADNSSVVDQAIVISNVSGFDTNQNNTFKSDSEVTFTFDPNRSLTQDIDDEINELYTALAASFDSSAVQHLQTRKQQLETRKTGIENNTINVGSTDASYSDTVNGLSTRINSLQDNITKFNNGDTSVTDHHSASDRDSWVTERDELVDVRTLIQGIGSANFSAQTLAAAEVQAEINRVNDMIADAAPAHIKQQIDSEVAFLNAKKSQLNTGNVDMVQVGDLYAATGNIFIEANDIVGSNTGQLTSKNDVTVTVRNSGNSPVEIGNITIPDDPGGTIYFNEQVVRNTNDIERINRGTASVNVGMTSDPGNFNPVVVIESTYDATAHANGLNIKSPELLLDGQIENRGGLVKVTNKYGSIYQSATINAGELKLTSGGNLFITNKNSDGIHNFGPHPTSGFSNFVDPREDSPGSGSSSAGIGGCYGNRHAKDSAQDSYPCNVANTSSAPQFSNSSAVVAAGKIFAVANTINLNGLIQSGIAEKTLNVGALDGLTGNGLMARFGDQIDLNNNGNLDSSEWTDQDGDGVFTLADLAGSTPLTLVQEADEGVFSGSGINREFKNLHDAYYDPSDESIIVSGFAPEGGEIFMAGKLISTGYGQLNVMDGYSNLTINNQSGLDLKIQEIDAGEVEGKITLIDNFKADPVTKLAKVTQYTRIGDNIVVKEGFGNPTNDVTSAYTSTFANYNGEQRRAQYNPVNGARYYFMNGEYVESATPWNYYKKTESIFYGIEFFNGDSFRPDNDDFEPSQIDPSDLPNADYAAIDTSITDDYRFKMRYEQTHYDMSMPVLNSAYDNATHSYRYQFNDYFFYQKRQWWLSGVEYDFGNYYYYHDVEADKPVDIRFIGRDAGTVAINSNAGIRLNGTLSNAEGTTSITADDDIIATNDLAKIEAGTLNLNATNIGDDNRSLRLIQGDNDIVNVVADGNVYLKSLEGNVNIRNFTNTGAGTVDIYAGESLTFDTSTTALRSGDLNLTAKYGSISDIGGNTVRIDTQNDGLFSAYSRTDGLNFTEVSDDLNVGVIDSISNVSLTTLAGGIKDGDARQVDDVAAQTALLALWNDLQLTGQNAENKRTAQITTFEGEMTSLYHDYWDLRDVQETSPGSGDYVSQTYDPNFTYQVTDAERAALNNDPTRIAQYEASKQARYQQGYEKFGNPSYDPNYTHTATALEIDDMTAGYKWEEHELEVALPGQSFKEVTDTTSYIENPNIIGDNITLTAYNGGIGIFGSSDNYSLNDITTGNLDNASKIKLAAAESDDVFFDNTTQTIILTPREDLDIKARFANSVININAPQGHAFIGGENSLYGLNINTIAAQDEVRLKINGDIFNVRNDNNAVLRSANAIIESGAGQIGTSTTPFRVDITSGSKLTARGANGIWLEEVFGDMEIGQVYSPTTVNLRSNTGAIVDFEEDLIMDVKGHNVSLFAAANIGGQYIDTDNNLDANDILLKKQRALDVATLNYDNSTFEVNSTTGGAWLYGPLGQSIRMTGANLMGELDVATGAVLKAQGNFQTNGNDMTLRSYEDMQLDGDGGINTNGALLRVISGQSLSVNGQISTQGGNIYAQAADNMTFVDGTRLVTQGGDFTAIADGLLNQNIMIEDNATIDTSAGNIRMSASDTIYVTGLRTTSNATCAAGQTGCAVTLLATDIQDNGNSFDDIEVNGNGDIRLQAHQYININKIDYNGGNPLQLDIAGKNDDARGVAAMLGVDAEAGINVSRLVMNSASIVAPLTSVVPGGSAFTVSDGRIRDNLYLDIGAGDTEFPFMARVGRLEDNLLEPDSWLLAADASSDYFAAAPAEVGVREDDYRCSGAPDYLGDANAILSFTFFFQRPNVNCNGVLVYYNPVYELASPKRTAKEEVLTILADLNRTTGIIAASPLTQALGNSGFVLNNVASQAMLSRALEISGQTVEIEGNQITIDGQSVLNRISLDQALISGTVDEAGEGYISIEGTGQVGADEIQLAPTASNDAGGEDAEDGETGEDSASTQTIEAIPSAQLNQNVGVGIAPDSFSVVDNPEALSLR